jgi:hypothetical protein
MLMRLEFKAKITAETPTLILVLDYNHSEVAKFLVKEGANVFARSLEEGQYTSPSLMYYYPQSFSHLGCPHTLSHEINFISSKFTSVHVPKCRQGADRNLPF